MIEKIEILNSSYTLFVPLNHSMEAGDMTSVSGLYFFHYTHFVHVSIPSLFLL